MYICIYFVQLAGEDPGGAFDAGCVNAFLAVALSRAVRAAVPSLLVETDKSNDLDHFVK